VAIGVQQADTSGQAGPPTRAMAESGHLLRVMGAGAMAEKELLTADEAAELLQVSLRTLRRWRTQGTGPPVVWVGRSPRYLRAEVLEWVRAQRERP
jgi:excisionase family DNA binding protein